MGGGVGDSTGSRAPGLRPAGGPSERHAARPDGEPFEPGTATADLHAHTTRSDGVLEPEELIRQAVAAGVRLLAIADHDNLAGFRELAAAGAVAGVTNAAGRTDGPPLAPPPGLDLLPAVEINAVTRGYAVELGEEEIHVLGLGVDPASEAFEAALGLQREARRIRFHATVERLHGLGLSIEDQVAGLDLRTDDALGRPTVARALVAAGHAETVDDAFQRILAHGRPGYVPRTGLGPHEAIGMIRTAGGLASLAHFAEAPKHEPLIRELMDAGLNGLETHHRSFGEAARAAMTAFATSLSLIETGGTDYHGDFGPYAESHAGLVLPDRIVAAFLTAIDPTRIVRVLSIPTP